MKERIITRNFICTFTAQLCLALVMYWAFSDMGVGIAPVILGAIATVFNYHALYYVAALISLIALPIYWTSWGKRLYGN